jgi:O-antigen ligase
VAGIPLTAVLPIILIASAFFNFIISGNKLSWGKLYPYYLMLLLSVCSFLNTMDYLISFGGLIKLMTALAIYLLVYNSVKTPEDVRKFLITILIAAVIPMLFGYYEYFTGTARSWGGVLGSQRITGMMGECNEYGEFLALTLVACLLLLKFTIKNRIWVYIAFISIILSLILGLNRGTWIALTIAIFLSSFIYIKKISLIQVMVLFSLIFLIFGGIVVSRFSELGTKNQYGGSNNTFQGRIQYWQKLTPIILESPLVGQGLGMSSFVAKKIGYAHNDYILLMLEIGIPAALLYFYFLIIQMKYFLNHRLDEYYWVYYLSLICTCYFAIISSVENIIFDGIVLPIYMVLIAIGHRMLQFEK